MGREQVIVNQSVQLGIRHFYNKLLADVYQFIDVKIQNPQGVVVHTIPASEIVHDDLGVYHVTVPGTVFNAPGIYRDVWELYPVVGAHQRNLAFDINVVTTPTAAPTNYSQALSFSLDDLDACLMKKVYLWPVWSVLSNGYYLGDFNLQYSIDNAITWMQRQLDMPLRRIRVRTQPFAAGSPNLVLGQDYDEVGRLIDWNVQDSMNWSQVKLPHTGIMKVWALRGIYGGHIVYDIPSDWVSRNELQNGVIRIRPTTAGSIANIVDGSGRFLDVTLLESIGMNNVPGFWCVDYDYGPIGTDEYGTGKFPREIGDVIMKKATIDILDQIGMAIGRGLSSRAASVDGLSSSIGNVANAERTIFGALVTSYQRDLVPENLMDLRRYYKGPSIWIC